MRILTLFLTLFLLVNRSLSEESIDEMTYVFFYGGTNFLHVSETVGIPVQDLLKGTVAVEARGWKRGFAGVSGHDEKGKSVATMWETQDMRDVVEGVAVPLPKAALEAMDKFHNHPHFFKREEMFLKQNDLGPIYRRPV